MLFRSFFLVKNRATPARQAATLPGSAMTQAVAKDQFCCFPGFLQIMQSMQSGSDSAAGLCEAFAHGKEKLLTGSWLMVDG
jgi:hypothetical protein